MSNHPEFYKDLTAAELALIKELDTPLKIQNYLDTAFRYRTEEGHWSPREALSEGRAHCFDGGLFAAAALNFHGIAPKLLILFPYARDDSHLLVLYKRGNKWGSLAKSNFAILTNREPVYGSLRELIMSYYDCYFNAAGEKTLYYYTQPVDPFKWKHLNWFHDSTGLDQLSQNVQKARRHYVISDADIANLERATPRWVATGMVGVDPNGLYKTKD